MKKIFKFIFFNSIILIILFILIELFLHTYKENHLKYDKTLGWILKENLNITKIEKDFYGKKYEVNFITNKNGIISYGDQNKNQILVIGDSFSTDPYVSTNKMWYSIFADNLKNLDEFNVNIKVVGAGGYGTFQQYLLLERLKEKLDPKLIIFQFCSNDLQNNNLNLEKINGSINQYSRRPYFKDNKIIYSDNFLSKLLRLKFVGESRIINKFFFMLYKNKKKNFLEVDLKHAKKITLNLLKKIREIFPEKDYYIFNCIADDFDLNFYAKRAKFKIINTVLTDLSNAKIENKKIYYKDGGHYNELGNKLIGDAIYNYFRKQGAASFLK